MQIKPVSTILSLMQTGPVSIFWFSCKPDTCLPCWCSCKLNTCLPFFFILMQTKTVYLLVYQANRIHVYFVILMQTGLCLRFRLARYSSNSLTLLGTKCLDADRGRIQWILKNRKRNKVRVCFLIAFTQSGGSCENDKTSHDLLTIFLSYSVLFSIIYDAVHVGHACEDFEIFYF